MKYYPKEIAKKNPNKIRAHYINEKSINTLNSQQEYLVSQ